MDESNFSTAPGTVEELSRKSWTAYIGVVVWALILLAIAYGLWGVRWWAGAGAGLLFAIYIFFRILSLRSYRLYCDDIGVWVYSGVLPWRKGVVGVKWRDIDEAVFLQGFGSWLLRSHSIRVGHRFTKSSEIFLHSMARVPAAVTRINEQHQARIRGDALP